MKKDIMHIVRRVRKNETFASKARLKNGLFSVFAGFALMAALLITAPSSPVSAATDLQPPTLSTNGLRTTTQDKPVKTEPRFRAPKGNPFLKPSSSNKKSSLNWLATPCASPCFTYNTGNQAVVAEGAAVNLTVHNTYLHPDDYHTLAEMAVQTLDGKQVVEVGWTVDESLYGDYKPRLFVFHWVNGHPTCYNACGFVDYGPNPVNVGADLSSFATAGTNPRFQTQYSGGNWWIAFNGAWIGYYPGTLWTNPLPSQGAPVSFTKSELIQAFGEIASSVAETCTDMGAGKLGLNVNGTAARIGSFSVINTVPAGIDAYFSLNSPPHPTKWTLEKATSGTPPVTSNKTFRYGGPGWNAAGTGVGIQNGC